ncbi:hypothetical protein DPMN_012144 [Dreissena polymorpha]|uniref:Uncharacterized protein n=1 Tax=Dreissena polymorpha TaxID=45954 RepID=A0A9D4S0N7_DREPO|nr:hypothetical protein DPMN_012144 [Dreissena polymorpha]
MIIDVYGVSLLITFPQIHFYSEWIILHTNIHTYFIIIIDQARRGVQDSCPEHSCGRRGRLPSRLSKEKLVGQREDWTFFPMKEILSAANNRPFWRRISVSLYCRPSPLCENDQTGQTNVMMMSKYKQYQLACYLNASE